MLQFTLKQVLFESNLGTYFSWKADFPFQSTNRLLDHGFKFWNCVVAIRDAYFSNDNLGCTMSIVLSNDALMHEEMPIVMTTLFIQQQIDMEYMA